MGRRALALSIALGSAAACGTDDIDDTGPFAADDLTIVEEDAPILIDVLANDSDPAGRPLELRRASAEGHVVTIEDGRVRVAAQPNWHGSIAIRYVVVAGEGSAWGRATVTVTPVNDAPAGSSARVVTGRNAPVSFRLAGEDVDGDALTYEVVDNPASGTVSGTGRDLTYTPAQNFVGVDTISYRVRDASAASEPATITIDVVNGAAPVAQAQSVVTAEDTPRAIELTATDSDSDVLTYGIATPPAHGELSGTPPNVVYTPALDYTGPDSFQFTASDGVLSSQPATVSITVSGQNDPPVATAQSVTLMEDMPSVITLAGVDPEDDFLTYAIVTNPTHGTAVRQSNIVTYTPAANYHGSDSFTFRVRDGLTWSQPATVSLSGGRYTDTPVASAQVVGVTEDTPRQIVLSGTDVDGDPLTFLVTGGNLHGDLTFDLPTVTYAPGSNYNGPASFTFTASDGELTSAPATVTINVAAVDDVPFVPGAALTGAEDALIDIPLPAFDVDGEPLTYTIATPPQHGAISGTGVTRQYRAVNYDGPDSFQLTARDGRNTSAPATFSVNVSPMPDAPIARDDVAVATPGEWLEIDVLANDDEVDGEVFFIQSITAPSVGEAQSDTERVMFRAPAGTTAPVTFTYTIVDAAGLTATATVTVGMNELPGGQPVGYVAHILNAANPLQAFPQHDLSDDGRYVAFSTAHPLDVGDTNQLADIYVWDRVSGAYERASVPAGGGAGDGVSFRASISGDGRYVAFQSVATNLVAGDTNGSNDVFVRDRQAGTTVRVSVTSSGAQVSGASTFPRISADGRVVAFVSSAYDLVPNDHNTHADVFVHELASGATSRVNVRTGGGEADAGAAIGGLSADGRVVVFVSSATNLVAGDTNLSSDVFVHDRTTGVTERVSVSSTGGEANGASSLPTVSSSGRFVGFHTVATNLVADSPNGAVLVRDREAETTISAAGSSTRRMNISGDGRYITGYLDDGSCFVRDRFTSTSHFFSTANGNDIFYPVLSRNGRYVAVVSNHALVPDVAAGTKVFVLPNPLAP